MLPVLHNYVYVSWVMVSPPVRYVSDTVMEVVLPWVSFVLAVVFAVSTWDVMPISVPSSESKLELLAAVKDF